MLASSSSERESDDCGVLTRVDPNSLARRASIRQGQSLQLTAACPDDASGGHEGVSRVDFWRAFNSNLFENRHQFLAEPTKRVLGLPDVNNAKALLSLSCDVDEPPSTGQSAVDSIRLRFPPVSFRTVSSYFCRVRVGD